MRRTLVVVTAVALATMGLGTSPSYAQTATQVQPEARVTPPAAPPQTMDLAMAKKMAAVAEAAAAAMSQHVAVCVMDTNGDVVLSERMDGGTRVPVNAAQGKARAVLLFGVPTGQIADAIRDKKPLSVMPKALPAGGGEITLLRGGLPVMKDGKLIGTIGVGGSTSENDEKFAQAGIDAMMAK
jgi:glc operon protein GlcG